MLAMFRRFSPSSSGLQSRVAGAVLAAVVVFTIWDAVVRGRHILAVSENYGVMVDAPADAPDSPTGYADGRRSLVLSIGAADTAHWIMQTQEMIANGDWRIRHVEYDNAPSGREVHWSAPLHWWLAGLAWLDHLASGRPVGQSVERAVLYSGPAMLLVLLVGLGTFLLREFSPLAAVLFALGAVAAFPFHLDFVSGYADHHGVANICGLLAVLLLVAGTRGESHERSRQWIIASGIAGGIGLWISAPTLVPVLFGIGLGFLAAGWMARRASEQAAWMTDPGLLRLWGLIGGGTSLAGWLLEYFPQHMGMRLEINHPIYAAAWAGAGEAMRVAMIAFRNGPRAVTPRDRIVGTAGVIATSLPLLVIVFSTAKTFQVADPFLWRIHSLHISEFQSLGRLLAIGLNRESFALCAPVLLLIPPVWMSIRKATDPGVRANLILVLVPAALAWTMGCSQIRWLSLAFAMSVPAVAVFFRAGEVSSPRSRASFAVWMFVVAALFTSGALNAIQRTMGGSEVTTDEIRSLAVRDVAHWLRSRVGADRPVVAASPGITTSLIYYGGTTGVGTLYWENAEGLRQIAALFATQSSDEARDIAMRLGVTHIVFFSWESFETTLARLRLGLADEAPLPADTFATRLLSSPVPPPWLQPIPLKLPGHPALAGSQMRVWEITPPHPPFTALARTANYFLELGRLEDAGRMVPLLSRFGEELPASVMLAAIASRQRDPDAFANAFAKVLSTLDRAESLSLDEHIHLVVVLTVAQQLDQAQAQLRQCMLKVNERTLRQLTPGTLADLLALGDGLRVSLPTPELQQLAVKLLPPDLRR